MCFLSLNGEVSLYIFWKPEHGFCCIATLGKSHSHTLETIVTIIYALQTCLSVTVVNYRVAFGTVLNRIPDNDFRNCIAVDWGMTVLGISQGTY